MPIRESKEQHSQITEKSPVCKLYNFRFEGFECIDFQEMLQLIGRKCTIEHSEAWLEAHEGDPGYQNLRM